MRHLYKILLALPAVLLSLSLVAGCGSNEPKVIPQAENAPTVDAKDAQEELESQGKGYDPKAGSPAPTGSSSPANL